MSLQWYWEAVEAFIPLVGPCWGGWWGPQATHRRHHHLHRHLHCQRRCDCHLQRHDVGMINLIREPSNLIFGNFWDLSQPGRPPPLPQN